MLQRFTYKKLFIMKWTIKAGLSRTYALRQYENIKPMLEIEIEFDTEDKNFDMQKTLLWLKKQCIEYIDKFNPNNDTEFDWELPF